LLSSDIDVNDAEELVFISKSGEYDVLYIYDLKTRTISQQFQFEKLVSLYSPNWSPDGKKIVFSGLAFTGKSDLYVFDRVEKNLMRLTDDFYDDVDPAWSSDGTCIAFSSDRGRAGSEGYYNLFLYELESGLIQYLTQGEYNDTTPCWSPDGEYLAFCSDRSGTNNIWFIERNKEQLLASAAENTSISAYWISTYDNDVTLKQVTQFTTGAFDPEWTSDGDLLFSAFENLSFQVNKIEAVGELFQTSSTAEKDPVDLSDTKWTFDKLSGTGGRSGIKYKPRYSLDIAQSQIALDPIFGTSGGMQLAISDMLGNYQYFFLLYNTARTRDEFLESFNFAVSRVDLSKRTNIALGAYHFAGHFYNYYDAWFWERRYGGFGALSYPLTKFKRLEATLNVRSSDKQWYTDGYRRKALLVSNFASFVKDNSLWGPTGPIDGERLNITVGNTIDVVHANVNFITTIVDYRRYYRLGTRLTHATRMWTLINHGKESTPFFMGGSWDLRGYKFWRIWGTKLALLSNELRFPFIDRFMLHFPFGYLAMNSIRGALFVDVGNAWDDELDHLLGSTGFGIRFRFGGMLVLRFDVGRKFTIHMPNRYYEIKQVDFENKWFTQFFFGWDF
jgi:Tol biopolymer transport system component